LRERAGENLVHDVVVAGAVRGCVLPSTPVP